jgi:hypothetical protein
LYYLLIASQFALCQHPLADPPHHRMEPEDSLHKHMKHCDQIVPMADVTKFMGDDGFQLRRRQSLQDAFW